MKNFLVAFTLTATCFANAGTSMKIEGSCSGTLADSTPISFNYFSDFDGCKPKSQAALSFTQGREGLSTGVRTFPKDKDMYLFNGKYRLTLANSTGNTSATFSYTDEETNSRKSVELQCDIRDYEYTDC